MTLTSTKNLDAGLAGARLCAQDHNYELTVDRDKLLDDNHCNTFWYGGPFAVITLPNQWRLQLAVEGPVHLTGKLDDGTIIDYHDLQRTGAASQPIADIITNDDMLMEMTLTGAAVLKNNYVAVHLLAPDGTVHDMPANLFKINDIVATLGHDYILPVIHGYVRPYLSSIGAPVVDLTVPPHETYLTAESGDNMKDTLSPA